MQPFRHKPNLAAFPQVGVRRNIDYVRRKNFGFSYGITSLDIASGDCSRAERYWRNGSWVECLFEARWHAAGGCGPIESNQKGIAPSHRLREGPSPSIRQVHTRTPR